MPKVFRHALIAGMCLCLLLEAAAAARAEAGKARAVGVHYDFPPQPSLEQLKKTDPDRGILTDGKAGATGPMAVWGKWNVKPFVVDWTFDKPVRIRAITLAIVHPRAASHNSHPARVCLFGGLPSHDAKSKAIFASHSDQCLDIAFQNGRVEHITVPLPGNGMIARRLRTRFESAKFQTVLSEVSFVTEPATKEELVQAQKARAAAQPAPLKPVIFLPAPASGNTPKPPTDSIFGVGGHMIHTDFYYPDHFSPYWRLKYTLPLVRRLGVGWVREGLYQGYFSGANDDVCSHNHRTFGENRAEVDEYLNRYDKAGVKVLLAVMFSPVSDASFKPYFEWIAQLAQDHPCIAAVEMHNEPNLGGFWKHSVRDYVDACREGATILKKANPQLPVVVGAFAGWGSAHNDKNVKAKAAGPRDKATAFAQEVFQLGALKFADGVSAHPYRNSSAPEGGLEIESPTDPDGFEKEIRDFWSLVEQYNKTHKPLKLYFTEIGYSSATTGYAGVGSLERQADYLSRVMLICFNTRLSGIPLQLVSWYDFKCDDPLTGDYESNFGLVSHDTSRLRPGYFAYQRIARTFGDTAAFEPAKLKASFSNLPKAVKCYTWRRKSDHAWIVAFWRMNQLQPRDADFVSELSLELPEGFTAHVVRLNDLHEPQPREMGFHVTGQTLHVPLRITARAAWLEIR